MQVKYKIRLMRLVVLIITHAMLGHSIDYCVGYNVGHRANHVITILTR
jgi:hypothetical protein